ncbi:MAG: S8 family serine peptidase, partial [Polyangiaceae bacterium]
MAVAAKYGGGGTHPDELPTLLKVPTMTPQKGQDWASYRASVEATLDPLREELKQLMGVEATKLVAGNALAASLRPAQIQKLGADGRIDMVELDPLVYLEMMDDAYRDVNVPTFRTNHPTLDGSGVKVAVLDSGVDDQHPYLSVSASVSTCGEPTSLPGSHGTHCAGSIASRDKLFRGVAPAVDLINVKVLRANGTGQHSFITQGDDEALDRDAEVLSMSIGFNQLPTWSQGGHGWNCANGHCPLCTAVDNAVTLDSVVVVVAAGNEHQRADILRTFGHPVSTELGCPGHAREALTVGAVTKAPFHVAPFSSHGPTRYKLNKPDLCAPGVNITSTIPVPRTAGGALVQSPARNLLFGRSSGTSMAT